MLGHRARAADCLDGDVLVSLATRHRPGSRLMDVERVAVSDEIRHLRRQKGVAEACGGCPSGACRLHAHSLPRAVLGTHVDLDGAQHLTVPLDFFAPLVGGDELD